jgi:hypothetical protein
MLFSAAIVAHGQTNHFPRNPIVPIFTNNPTAMLVVSNLLNEPQPPLSVPVVSHTNTSSGGVYWALTSPGPLPFNPYPDLDVYQVSSNNYIIDDRSVDYAELNAENASNNPVTFQPQGQPIDTNGLYLQVPTNSLATPNYFTVNVVNTIIGQSYDILTKADLPLPSWMTVLTTNAVSNITQVQVPRITAHQFVWARESTGASFYINTSPLSQTVEVGDSVTFSVATGGNPNLTYQWTFNGVAIAGATNSSYTLNNVASGDGGQYAVTISDGVNPQTTPAAQLTTDSSNPFGFPTTGNANLIPILSSRQDYTFKSGNTYYISAVNSFYGQTTIEGGAVIKPDWYYGGSVQIVGTLACNTKPYYPAIFTSVDDDSVGEMLGFSQQDGAPFPANNGLAYLDLTYAQSNAVVSNVQMKFADLGVTTPPAGLDIWDSQFYECDYAVVNLVNGGTNNLHNILFADCNDAVRATTNAITINGEQVTADVTRFCQATATPNRIALTNSLYWGTTVSAASLSTVNVTRNPNGTNFASEGYGNYYLAANSPLHNAGSGVISPRLQSELQHKTTYAPVPIAANMTISGNLTFSPQAQRYTNGAPDIGYYYDALDYTVAGLTLAGGNLTVLPNTAIALRNEFIASNSTYTVEGFFVEQGSSIISHGTPTKPNIFTAEKLVQETPETGFAGYRYTNGWWFGGITFVTDSEPDYENSLAAVYDFRFSQFYLPPSDYHFWSGYDEYGDYALEVSPDSSMYLSLQDCQLYGGRINLGNPDQSHYSPTQVYLAGALSWINNSFENTAISLDPTYYRANGIVNCDMQLLAYNNLFKGGSWILLEPFPATAGHWTFRDNLFDKVNFLQDASQPLDFDHNGYWALLPREFPYGGSAGELAASTGGTDSGGEVTLSNAPPYQTSVFGNFYLPTNMPLYGAGSRSPAAAGLFHYSTRLDQTKEGNEPAGHMVNIGVHYVAASGNVPKDTDGDGVPDYVEDANGNGVVDFNAAENVNETDWQNPMTDGATNDAYNVAYDDIDLSGDGLVGRIKKALAINPLNPSNPLALTQIITGDEPDVVTFEIPISYNTLTNIGGLELCVDGDVPSFQELDPATDGNCLLVWNTTYSSPNLHSIQAQFNLNGKVQKGATPAPTVLSGMGAMNFFNSGNVMQFDPFYSTYDPSSGAILYATLPEPEANYSIEIKTISGSHIKTISGSTTDGIIKTNWNLTDDSGNVIADTSDPVKAIFNVTLLDPGSGTNSQTLSPDSNSVSDGNFTVAYAWDNATIALNEMWDAIENAVVDDLISPPESGGSGSFDPYNSTFNTYTWSGDLRGNPGYLSSQTIVTQTNGLYDNLTSLDTRNFYFDGHGSRDSIGDSSAPGTGGIDIDTGVLLNRLHNYVSPRTGIIHRGHPYRFVFLNACETANDSGWADTFGIPKTIKQSEVEDEPEKVQGFLGWNGSPAAPVTADDWDQTAQTYTVFFNAWMLGNPLADCLTSARSRNPFGDGSVILQKPLGIYIGVNYYVPNLGNWLCKPRIFGYPGITRNGFIGGYDGIYQK